MTSSLSKMLLVVLMITTIGCGVPRKPSSKDDSADGPFQPIVDDLSDQVIKNNEKMGELKLSAESSASLVDTLSRVLGSGGELTWNSESEHAIDIGNGGTVTLHPGTKIQYESSEFGTVFTFSNPRPSVRAPAGPIKVKVALVSVDFHKDNSGTAKLDTGVFGITKSHKFKIDFDDTGEKKVETPAAKAKPVVWCYSPTWYCEQCEIAKAEIAKHSDLPFDVRFTSEIPSWVNAYPTFHWNDASGKSWKSVGWGGMEDLKIKVLGNTSAMKFSKKPTITWSLSNGDTKPNLIEHLLNDGIHRGKFKRSYLECLTRDQLVMLHSDDHNNQ